MQLKEIFEALTRPFPPEMHQERDLPGGGRWLFVPWQAIRDRLNEVCPDWQVEYGTPFYLEKYCVVNCKLTICGVTREAWGNAEIELLSKSGKSMARGNGIERAIADAFKNAAESFGVAAYLDEQSADKRDFTIRYLHSQGDGRGVKAARENGWTPGNLPTTQQKAVMREQEKAQRRAPANAISEKQAQRLWAIAKKSGFTDDGLHRLIAKWGFGSTKAITGDWYNQICEYAEDPGQAAIFNQEPSVEEPKPFDRKPTYKSIITNMKRLEWSKEIGAAFVKDNYGKAGCEDLDDGELIDLADFLDRQVAALQQPQAS